MQDGHVPVTDARCRQDAGTQHHHISVGLRQRAAEWHDVRQPRQTAGGTEFSAGVVCHAPRRVPPAPPNYDGGSTGCQFDSGSLTSWQSSPTAHDQPIHQST